MLEPQPEITRTQICNLGPLGRIFKKSIFQHFWQIRRSASRRDRKSEEIVNFQFLLLGVVFLEHDLEFEPNSSF